MAEHTRGQDPKDKSRSTDRTVSGDVHQNRTGRNTDSSLDGKSSGIGRREKDSSLATKDGLTGSDDDGQLTR